jgi:hypothetical protein
MWMPMWMPMWMNKEVVLAQAITQSEKLFIFDMTMSI